MKRLLFFCFMVIFTIKLSAQLNVKAEKFSPERLERIDQVINNYVDSNWIVGAVCLIMKDGEPAYFKAFGMDNQLSLSVKETTTVNKINDRNKMPTAHSGTFACSNTRAIASQAKEPEFLPMRRIKK